MRSNFLLPWAPVSAVLALAGCESPRDTRHGVDAPATQPQTPPRAEPQPLKTPTPEPGEHTLEDSHVEWPSPSTLATDVVGRLSEAARASIAQSRVPVLVPRSGAWAARAGVIAKPAFTAVDLQGSGDDDGLHVSLSGTRVAHRYRSIEPIRATSSVRGGRPAWVLQNEGIWSVSWSELGVSYVVDLECAQPMEDARCSNADRVLEIVEDLVFVGGARAEGGAR